MENMIHKGLKREYILYKPSNIKNNRPLVVFLHWYTGNAQEMVHFSGFNDLADKYQFSVAYPEGLLDKDNQQHWNSNLSISDYDDVGFIETLVNKLVKEHHFNKEQVFVTGISNGGFMCYTLANRVPNLFKAYAPVIGTMSRKDWEEKNMNNPVPILHICGLDDELVPPYGKTVIDEDGWDGAPNVDIIMEFWAKKASLDKRELVQKTENTTIEYYTGDDTPIEVWCVKIANHGHEFPRANDDIDGGELIWSFFNKYV